MNPLVLPHDSLVVFRAVRSRLSVLRLGSGLNWHAKHDNHVDILSTQLAQSLFVPVVAIRLWCQLRRAIGEVVGKEWQIRVRWRGGAVMFLWRDERNGYLASSAV